MKAENYGAFVVLLGIVVGVSDRQLLVKPIWEGESPINVEEEGIDFIPGSIDVRPGDFVRAVVKVVEKRIPRTRNDLEYPLVTGGERYMKLVSLKKIDVDELLQDLREIQDYIVQIHYKDKTGGEEYEGPGDWTWVGGPDSS